MHTFRHTQALRTVRQLRPALDDAQDAIDGAQHLCCITHHAGTVTAGGHEEVEPNVCPRRAYGSVCIASSINAL